MCYIGIYSVTRNQRQSLLFFPLICYEKKTKTFFSVNVKRADLNSGAQAHTLESSVKGDCSNN